MVDFSEKLNQCLDAIDDGHELQDLLRRYPDDCDELITLLKLSMELRQLRFPTPSSSSRLLGRNRLLAAADARGRRSAFAGLAGYLFPIRSFRGATTIALASVLLACGTIAISKSLPGGPFYQVKLALEQVQLTAAIDPAAKVRLRLTIANDRLSEAERLLAKGQLPQARGLVSAYDAEITEVAPQAAGWSYAPGDLDSLALAFDEEQLAANARLQAVARTLAADGDAEGAAIVAREQRDIDRTLEATRSSLHSHAHQREHRPNTASSPELRPSAAAPAR